jgi:thiol:disulfide interchange protein
MNFRTRVIVVLVIALTFLVAAQSSQAQPRAGDPGGQILDSVPGRADLYPATADAKKEISEALQTAQTEKKRVLLIFGANWCYDCHVLDHALHDGDAGKIVTEKFLLVHVDIGEGAKNTDLISKYKIPLDKGVPAVAILDGNGKLLYSSGDGEFEAARKMRKKYLLSFLQHWKP